jgi:clan AA aspartic protease (TIGR02281 family)
MLFNFRLLTLVAGCVFCLQLSAQTIKMEKKGGVYYVPCKVNGLGLKFIFDTGASDVSISSAEAVFMLKNGYMNEADLGGSEYYRIANGDIAEGTKVVLRKIEIGERTLYNVEASIVHSIDAPLLLGQSVMEKLGQFTIDYASNSLIIGKAGNTPVSNGSNSQQINAPTNTASSSIPSVVIGKQEWMSKNLDVDKFRNGQTILYAKTAEEWRRALDTGQPAWCYYDNDQSNGVNYGKLYNWYAVTDPIGLCPVGWHVPSDAEWTIMEGYLGGVSVAGGKIKSTDSQYWQSPSTDTGNKTGFSGLPGGYRSSYGTFLDFGCKGYWWSSTAESGSSTATYLYINCKNAYLNRYYHNKSSGLSVRCLRDKP